MQTSLAAVAAAITRTEVGPQPTIWIPSIVWAILGFMQPILAVWNEKGVSEVEALHPVNALLLFALTIWLSYRAWEMVSEPPAKKPMVTMAARPTPNPAVRGPAPPVMPPTKR